jgi:hypothetical protein
MSIYSRLVGGLRGAVHICKVFNLFIKSICVYLFFHICVISLCSLGRVLIRKKVDFSEFVYDDPLISVQWEDHEASHGKTPSELVACNS